MFSYLLPSHPMVRPLRKRSFLLLSFFLVALFPILFYREFRTRAAVRSTWTTRLHRPLIIFPKPRKTGSTAATSMIGLAVLRSGGEVAPCSITEMMVLDSQLYGYMQRYDFLGCHANFRSVSMSALAALQRPVAIVTTNRKPVSWFYSAAVRCWERRNRRLTKDEQILKEAIDDALEDRYDFTSFRKSFLSNHGLSVTSSAEDVRRIANVYTYVFDHETLEEDVNHALVDMGYPKSYPTVRRVGVYKKDWAENYRVDEIRKLLNVEEMLYQALKKVRDLKDEKLQNTIRRDGSLIMMQFSSVGRNNETREDVLKRLGQT